MAQVAGYQQDTDGVNVKGISSTVCRESPSKNTDRKGSYNRVVSDGTVIGQKGDGNRACSNSTTSSKAASDRVDRES